MHSLLDKLSKGISHKWLSLIPYSTVHADLQWLILNQNRVNTTWNCVSMKRRYHPLVSEYPFFDLFWRNLVCFDNSFIFSAQMLANNSRGPILQASGHEWLFSSTASTCFYAKYRYYHDILSFAWFYSVWRAVNLTFPPICCTST